MKKTGTMALSDLVNVSVCTYRWPLRIPWEDLGNFINNDLDEIKTDDNKVNVEWRGLVDMNVIDIDYEMDDWIWNYINDKFRDNVETDKLIEAFAKYGIEYKGLSFYKHKWEYNFAWDTLDMDYEYDDDIDWKEKYPELIDEVKYYIDNVRKKSCDWYCSFEPNKVDEVWMWDYAYKWAILHKEWIFDEVKKSVEDWVYDILTDCPYEYDISTIVLRGEDWYIDWDTKYYVDYNEKILRPIKD